VSLEEAKARGSGGGGSAALEPGPPGDPKPEPTRARWADRKKRGRRPRATEKPSAVRRRSPRPPAPSHLAVTPIPLKR